MEPMQTTFEGTDAQGAESALLGATQQYEAVEKRARVAWLRGVQSGSTKESFMEWIDLNAIKVPITPDLLTRSAFTDSFSTRISLKPSKHWIKHRHSTMLCIYKTRAKTMKRSWQRGWLMRRRRKSCARKRTRRDLVGPGRLERRSCSSEVSSSQCR